jgi:hypothetical protein
MNVQAGTIEEGGSTITQQLVKNLYTGGDRTIARKLSEASLAWQLEDRLSKDQILTRCTSAAERTASRLPLGRSSGWTRRTSASRSRRCSRA